MMETATLYGFGSFFQKDSTCAGDVDLLILHQNVGRDSIEFAISCKRMVRAVLPQAHVVMLSGGEERELEFLRRCNAVYLGPVVSDFAREQIVALTREIVESLSEASGDGRQLL
jgi:hypothetical protein